ncbi:MAG: hypothetical protein ChlgKO_08740 [Chlamydiales bacterium]
MSSIATIVEYKNSFWAILKKDNNQLPEILINSDDESTAEFYALALAGQKNAIFVPKDRHFISIKKRETTQGTKYHIAEGSLCGRVSLFASFALKSVAEKHAQAAAEWCGLVYVPNYYKADQLVHTPPLPLLQSRLESQRKDRVAYSWEG